MTRENAVIGVSTNTWCFVVAFPQTNYSFGYAFINFVAEEGAQRAIKCLNGVTVRNKRLKVRT